MWQLGEAVRQCCKQGQLSHAVQETENRRAYVLLLLQHPRSSWRAAVRTNTKRPNRTLRDGWVFESACCLFFLYCVDKLV